MRPVWPVLAGEGGGGGGGEAYRAVERVAQKCTSHTHESALRGTVVPTTQHPHPLIVFAPRTHTSLSYYLPSPSPTPTPTPTPSAYNTYNNIPFIHTYLGQNHTCAQPHL